MNSASQPHQHPHQHHAQLVFGQLPPTTYENAVPPTSAHHQAQIPAAQPTSAPITIDTSSPPLNYSYHPGPGGQQVSQPQQAPPPPPPTQASNGTAGSTSGGGGRRGPGSIKWTKEGVSASAERRLPFVHRFRPVDLPPPSGLLNAASASVSGQQQTYSHTPGSLGPHVSKALNKMSQYETNPVGALQERYQSRGVLPSYRVVQFEGMSHNPVFTYQVTIGDMSTMGSGNSKKQAKHAAARAMLDKIDGRVPAAGMNTPAGMPQPNLDNKTITSQSGTEAISQSNGANGTPGTGGNGTGSPGAGNGTGNGSGTSLPSNPIGSIQEYCVKCSLPLPIYDLQNTSGQPHQRNFEIIAKVGAIASNGTGTSKKDAKRDAATALLDKLKALGSEVANAAGAATNGTEGVDEELAQQVSNMKVDILTPKHSKVLQDFYHKLQDSGKAKLLALVRTSLRDPKLDCVRLLAELSTEQNFDVTYVDIEERNANGEVQCLVQISTMPVAVCHGTGVDQSAANNVSARNALEYLKIMVKKPQPITQSNQGKNGTAAATETNGKKISTPGK